MKGTHAVPFFPLQMTKEEAFKKIKAEFYTAISAYFQAETSAQGKDDAETVFEIFEQHWQLLEVFDSIGDLPDDDSDPSVIDVDEDGLHLANPIGGLFNSGVLTSLDNESQREILFACIYALNTKLNRLENDWRARWYEQQFRNRSSD